MNSFDLTYQVRGVRPEREAAVREALAKFIEEEALFEEAGDPPWAVEGDGPGALRVDSVSPVNLRGQGYSERAEKRLTKLLGAKNGAPCVVRVQAVDTQDLDEDEGDERWRDADASDDD